MGAATNGTRNRRHDLHSDMLEPGSGRRRLFVDENGLPVSDARSDAATFSNLNPNTSEANHLGGSRTQYILSLIHISEPTRPY